MKSSSGISAPASTVSNQFITRSAGGSGFFVVVTVVVAAAVVAVVLAVVADVAVVAAGAVVTVSACRPGGLLSAGLPALSVSSMTGKNAVKIKANIYLIFMRSLP